MNKEARTMWFEALPTGIRRKIDGYVLQDQATAAIRLVTDVGVVRFDIGVGTAQLIVGDRYQHYGDRIARSPDDPLDLESLAFLAAGLGERIVAIEAVWTVTRSTTGSCACRPSSKSPGGSERWP